MPNQYWGVLPEKPNLGLALGSGLSQGINQGMGVGMQMRQQQQYKQDYALREKQFQLQLDEFKNNMDIAKEKATSERDKYNLDLASKITPPLMAIGRMQDPAAQRKGLAALIGNPTMREGLMVWVGDDISKLSVSQIENILFKKLTPPWESARAQDEAEKAGQLDMTRKTKMAERLGTLGAEKQMRPSLGRQFMENLVGAAGTTVGTQLGQGPKEVKGPSDVSRVTDEKGRVMLVGLNPDNTPFKLDTGVKVDISTTPPPFTTGETYVSAPRAKLDAAMPDLKTGFFSGTGKIPKGQKEEDYSKFLDWAAVGVPYALAKSMVVDPKRGAQYLKDNLGITIDPRAVSAVMTTLASEGAPFEPRAPTGETQPQVSATQQNNSSLDTLKSRARAGDAGAQSILKQNNIAW